MPRFTTHHMPTSPGKLVPDCLCESCSEVRRAWVGAELKLDRLADRLCRDCELCYVEPGSHCHICLARSFNVVGQAQHDKFCTCPACSVLHSAAQPAEPLPRPPLGPPLVERTLSCCTCRRVFCAVLARADATIVVLCPGCAQEGR